MNPIKQKMHITDKGAIDNLLLIHKNESQKTME